jgi:hypothetical protein
VTYHDEIIHHELFLNVKENRKSNQEWTLQRHWEHNSGRRPSPHPQIKAKKNQKQKQSKNKTQKIKKQANRQKQNTEKQMSNTNYTKTPRANPDAHEW